jgi:hypothetical protein
MSATISLRSITGRRVDATLSLIQHSLIIVGLMVALGTFKPFSAAVRYRQPAGSSRRPGEALSPKHPKRKPSSPRPKRCRCGCNAPWTSFRVATGWPRKRWCRSSRPRRRLAGNVASIPLLIIAIIGIESRFNPFAESASGAKGLMQVIPGYHLDKVPQGAGEQPFLDPVTNIQVGVHVLEEAIRWRGSLIAGLQHYGGAPEDAGNRVREQGSGREGAPRAGGPARSGRPRLSISGFLRARLLGHAGTRDAPDGASASTERTSSECVSGVIRRSSKCSSPWSSSCRNSASIRLAMKAEKVAFSGNSGVLNS